MLLKYTTATALLLGAVLLVLHGWPERDPAAAAERIAESALRALARADYAAFVAHGDKSVKQMREEHFRLLAERNAPRLKLGHTLRPLDTRWRGDVHVSRWQVVFKDGSRDAILTLGVRDGRVATFALP